jgi:predicted enzyme related to lactoylglutathione lyase
MSSKLHYLEVVTPEVSSVCKTYIASLNASFSGPVNELGGARIAELPDGGMLGIRPPMHDAEEATTRPYYLVDDIDAALERASAQGALVAVPPMDIPGYGRCAIVMMGSIQSGYWQR